MLCDTPAVSKTSETRPQQKQKSLGQGEDVAAPAKSSIQLIQPEENLPGEKIFENLTATIKARDLVSNSRGSLGAAPKQGEIF